MTDLVFLARPVTDARDDEVEWALQLRDALVERGISVRFGGVSSDVTDAEVAVNNIDAVVTSTALIALIPWSAGPTSSSVWVEIGIALAASVPVLIVPARTELMRLPFVVGAMVDESSERVVRVDGSSTRDVAEQISLYLMLPAPSEPESSESASIDLASAEDN